MKNVVAWVLPLMLLGQAGALAQPKIVRGPGAAALDPSFQQVLRQPDDIDLNLAFARRAIELEDFEAAVATLERLLIGRTDLPLIRLELGMLYLRLEAPELAQAYFQQAAEDPTIDEVARQRALALLAETQKANARSSFGMSVSVSLKHQSNAVTRAAFDDLDEMTALQKQVNAAVADIDRENSDQPDSDVGGQASIGVTYSRELAGLVERRFNLGLNHFTSQQNDAALESLNINVTSLRAAFVLPLQRRSDQAPLSFSPYLSANLLSTEEVRDYSNTVSFGVSMSSFLTPRNPLGLTLEVGEKTHRRLGANKVNNTDDGRDGGRHNISLTLGQSYRRAGYTGLTLKYDVVDALDDKEASTGAGATLSHNITWGGINFGANIGYRETERQANAVTYGTDSGTLQTIEVALDYARKDEDVTAGLTMSRKIFGVNMALGVSYIDRDSNIPSQKYDDLSGTLSFSRSFQ